MTEEYDDARGTFSIEFPEVNPLVRLMVCEGCGKNRASHRIKYRGVLLNENTEIETRYQIDAFVCSRCAHRFNNAFHRFADNMRRDGLIDE